MLGRRTINLLGKREVNALSIVLLIIAVGCCWILCSEAVLANDINKRIYLLSNEAKENSKKGNHKIAINLINRAIKISPRDIGLYYQRAFIYGRAGLYLDAIKDFNSVIKADRMRIRRGGEAGFPHAPRFRADCFVALGYMKQAIADYNEFLRRAPKDGKVWSYLAEAYALAGRNDLALDAIQKGLATGSHWSGRLKELQREILSGKGISAHRPFSN